MPLFLGPMMRQIKGYKELTKHGELVKVSAPKTVAIPLCNMGSQVVEVVVNPGDNVQVGTLLGYRSDHFYVPFFSSVSGKVVEVKKMMHAGLTPVNHLVIENDGLMTKAEGFRVPVIKDATSEELVEFTKNAGIVGCGGAGFPTYVKYKAQGIHTLLINCVECEPYITADYVTMHHYPEAFVKGVEAAVKMLNVQKVVVAFKDYKHGQDKAELKALYEAPLKAFVEAEMKFVPDAYPLGWERTLIYSLYRKRYDKLPSELGIVVNNGSTMVNLGRAFLEGHGIVDKIITVAGDGITESFNVEVPVGVMVSEITQQLKGYTSEEVLMIAGGPMMGKTIPTDQFVVNPYMNALTINVPKPINEIACLRCGRCTDNCPSGLQPVKIDNASKVKNVKLVDKLCALDCIECGLCSYVCPSFIPISDNVRSAKRIATRK
jgi:Na+-translocating ferredoxin:NAD+ oxidoreductase subunit C